MAERAVQHEYEAVNIREKKTLKCSSSRLCSFILVVSAVFNAVLLGVLIHMQVSKTNSQHQDMRPTRLALESGSLCVSCDSLQVHNDVITESTSYVTEKNLDQTTRLCCMKHFEGLGRLLSLLVNEYHTDLHVSTSDAEVKARPLVSPSAHMYLNLTNLKNTGNKLTWTTEPGLGTAHISGGIAYKNGSYVIPQDGVYNVYSFLTSKTGDAVNVDLNLVHAVCRLRHQEGGIQRQVLLLDKMSRSEGPGVFSTNYLSASLNLQKNDIIYVEFSNTSLIYTYAPANFFGIYML